MNDVHEAWWHAAVLMVLPRCCQLRTPSVTPSFESDPVNHAAVLEWILVSVACVSADRGLKSMGYGARTVNTVLQEPPCRQQATRPNIRL